MTSLLVIGGARSGKSRYAQSRAEAQARAESPPLAPYFIATAQAFDNEMRERIKRHQDDRSDGWITIEAPVDLAEAITRWSTPGRVLLVDCLTLWTSNLLLGDHDIAAATTRLIQAIAVARGPIILVANEVGWSIVPDNALARRFRDEAGVVNQHIAEAVSEVQLVAAGLPLKLK